MVDKDVNAFSVPGGFIYMHTGLIDNAESEAEIAGVLAHEIAHASHRHLHTLAREYSKASTLTTIAALVVAVFADGRDAVNTMNAQQLFLMALTSGWSEQAEMDAEVYAFINKHNEDHMRAASQYLDDHPEYRPDLIDPEG